MVASHRIRFASAFASLFIAAAAQAAGTWSAIAPMPTPRAAPMGAAVGQHAYAIGGNDGACGSFGTVQAFDTVSEAWSTRAPLPTPRWGGAAVAVQGKIYVLGGFANCFTSLGVVEAYDPASNAWSTRTPMPTARRGHAAAAIGTKIYVVGGLELFGFATALHVYDTATDTWSTGAPLLSPRLQHAAVALDGKLYVIGSFLSGNADVVVYDPETNAWTARAAAAPEGRLGHSAVVLGGAIHALGGARPAPPATLARMDRYDPAADAWVAEASMLQGREAFAAAVVGNTIYAMGGTANFTTILGSAEAYTAGGPGDVTPPQAAASASPPPNSAGWNAGDVTVTLAATDEAGGSGVASISYEVTGAGGPAVATVAGASAVVPVTAEGETTITFRATDVAGNVGADGTLSVRIDRTPPSGTLSLSPNVIWPPNNKMVVVTPTLGVFDAGGDPVSVEGPTVTSNEPASAGGDWEVSGGVLRVRATRNGKGSGRVYTVTYRLTDAAGNTSQVSATVAVPHDRGR